MKKIYENKLDLLFKAWQRESSPGGQIIICKSDEVIYKKCFGLSNIENKVPITEKTIFHVASVSKQFTVLAILILLSENKLSLNDEISKYVSDLLKFKEKISIKELINNISGIRDQWELLFMRGMKLDDSIDMADVNNVIKMQKSLNFSPSSSYLYSNTGFHILAVIVERVSGLRFNDFVNKYIFKPLGMEKTTVKIKNSEIIDNIAYSYSDEGTNEFFYTPLNYSLYGPTSVNTCANDLLKVLDEYMEPKVFDKSVIDIMKQQGILRNGTNIEYCGGLIREEFDNIVMYGHGGADASYRSYIGFIPDKNIKIVLLSNTNSLPMAKTAKQAVRIVLDKDMNEIEIKSIKKHCGPSEGAYITNRPSEPLVLEIVKSSGKFLMRRQHCDVELEKSENGEYRVGYLDEFIVFNEDGASYRVGEKKYKLYKCEHLKNNDSVLGKFYSEELDISLKIEKTEKGLKINIPRYGSTYIYTVNSELCFSFNPEFNMFMRFEDNDLILDGYRALNMRFKMIK